MTYDAVLVARRGLGADELQLASPGFLGAVRWSLFAERVYDGVDDLRALEGQDPSGLTGQRLTDFQQARTAARAELKKRRAAILLDEADG